VHSRRSPGCRRAQGTGTSCESWCYTISNTPIHGHSKSRSSDLCLVQQFLNGYRTRYLTISNPLNSPFPSSSFMPLLTHPQTRVAPIRMCILLKCVLKMGIILYTDTAKSYYSELVSYFTHTYRNHPFDSDHWVLSFKSGGFPHRMNENNKDYVYNHRIETRGKLR